MPIEIKELHIRIMVNTTENGGSQGAAQFSPPQTGRGSTVDKESIVAECVEQVMQILQEKRER